MNKYDRIFKENVQSLIPFLITKVLGLRDVLETEELKDKIQLTLEQEADYLRKVIHTNKRHDYILQIEFQSTAPSNMARRMLLYQAFLRHKYNLPVKQFVIFIGDKNAAAMPTHIYEDNLMFRYQVVDLRTIDYKFFLYGDQPEEVILAILGDLKGREIEEIVNEIIERLNAFTKDGLDIQKYFVQLRVIANLRNIQEETIKLLKNMALKFKYDIQKDGFYLEGKEDGRIEGKEEGISQGISRGISQGISRGISQGISETQHKTIVKMLQANRYTIEEIADINDVTASFVRSIEKKLQKKT
jgi:predicted transposase YdaD